MQVISVVRYVNILFPVVFAAVLHMFEPKILIIIGSIFTMPV